jgi:hypothetical protein
MTETVVETVAERASGRRPSRGRALLAAAVIAVGAGVVSYKLLRADA